MVDGKLLEDILCDHTKFRAFEIFRQAIRFEMQLENGRDGEGLGRTTTVLAKRLTAYSLTV